MKAIIYRPNKTEGHASWRPKSLTDMRGPVFPDEYHELLTVDAESVDHAIGKYSSRTGDVLFLGEGDELIAYVIGPLNWEMVKFGREWRSP